MTTSSVSSVPLEVSDDGPPAEPSLRRSRPAVRRRSRPARSASALLRSLALALRPDDGAQRQDRAVWFPLLCGALAAAFLVLRLLLPTPVGMADQGDGTRLLCTLGVASTAPFDYAQSMQHVYLQWTPHTWYGEACGAGGSGEPYYSTQTLLVLPALVLTPLLDWGAGLDLRALGIVSSVVFGLLLAALVALLPGRRPFRALIAGLITVVMADGVFADFFISPYSEAASMLGLLAVVVALLYHWAAEHPRWPRLVLVTVAASFAIGSKTQMIALLPVLAVALLWRREDRRRDTRTAPVQGSTRLQRVLRWLSSRLPAAVAAAAVLAVAGFGAAYVRAQPERFAELNSYNAIFVEMLPHSPDPQGDLEWFGLDASFLSASGTTVNSENAAVHSELYPEFLERVSLGRIVVFYLAHPARLISMADRGLFAIGQPVLGYLGSYTEDAGGEPGAKEHRVPVVETVFTVLGAAPLSFFVLQAVTAVLGWAVAARERMSRQARGLGRATVVLVVATWLQFWAVMLSEGASEIYKHLIVVGFSTALCLPLLVALVMLVAQASAIGDDPRGRRSSTVPSVLDGGFARRRA